MTGILFVLMMRHLQNISIVARGTGAALANASMYIGQMIGRQWQECYLQHLTILYL